MRVQRWMSAAAAAAVSGLFVVQAQPASAAVHVTVTVHHGHLIQAAIDNAAPGTTITVEPGTYHENLVIAKDGITLRGEGEAGDVRLLPPTKVAPVCGASATSVSGICVADVVSVDSQGNPMTKTVHNVRISNITIRNFSDSGIFMLDTSRSRVDHVRSYNNSSYGIFILQSTGPRITDSVAVGNHEAGIYVGQSPAAAAVISENDTHGNGIGIFFRDSRGATINDNRSNGNCVGMLVLNTGSPTGAGEVTATDNTVDRNNRECPQTMDAQATSGIGIALLGADHVTLRENTVDGNRPSGATLATGGILLLAGSSNVTVDENELHHNSTDILVDVPSATNHFTENDCRTSSPSGLCD